MARPAPLPLALDQIPASLRRFCDPAAPGPARMMAARGMVPVKGADQVMLLLQLSADPDEALAKSARGSLDAMPPNVLLPMVEGALPESFLDRMVEHYREREDVCERAA